MTLLEFRDLLLTIGVSVYHYSAHQDQGNYIVWAEYGDKAMTADNRREERALCVQVDLFTKIEFDPTVDEINSALNRDDISFEYLCDYEQDTGYIHHIWDCEVA
jgi:hypothetical protein